MARKRGRPSKSEISVDSQGKIIESTIDIIREKGADRVTVRNVCARADVSIGTFYHYFRDKDDLMMYFVRETPFSTAVLEKPVSDISSRLCELYMILINRYLELGEDFMKSFYSTSNRSLSAYMSEQNGSFLDGTVMQRSELELNGAIKAGFVRNDIDAHRVCMDVCTIVKGCVFEWCLVDGKMNIEDSLKRILDNYLRPYLNTDG